RPVVFEFERAERMRDLFDGIRYAVRIIVHRVYVPLVPGPVMRLLDYPVHDGITHVDVARGHVDLRPENERALRELALLHAPEEVEVLLGRAVPPGTVLSGLAECAPVLSYLVGGQAVYVGLPRLYKRYGVIV